MLRRRLVTAVLATATLAIASVGPALAAERTDVTPELVPKAQLQPAPESEVNVSYAPAVPPASGRSEPALVEVEFEVVENVTAIDPATGVEYVTWGYRLPGDEGEVSGTPGPMIRARVGDVLRFTITNPEGNEMPHNVDFHAVTGQGGGAANTVVAPGMTAVIEARLLYPGMFMYHCAMGDVPEHIARGMYGGILVDPLSPCRTPTTSGTSCSPSSIRPRPSQGWSRRTARRSPPNSPRWSCSTAPRAHSPVPMPR